MALYTPTYGELRDVLSNNLALLVFKKKDDTFRTMLATADASLLNTNYDYETSGRLENQLTAREKIATMLNRNIAVIDIMIQEVRVFNADRLVYFATIPLKLWNTTQGAELQTFEAVLKIKDQMNGIIASGASTEEILANIKNTEVQR